MLRYLKLAVIIGAAMAATACGFINTGEVGVRTTFGKVNPTEEGVGFYTSVVSDLDKYSVKEIPVSLDNMTPKAHDNLLLSDLDVTVRYEFAPDKVADFAASKQGQSARIGSGPWLPGYVLVDNFAHAVVSDEVSKIDSLVMHQKREALSEGIKVALQEKLETEAPHTFKITNVTIRTVKTDPEVEESIRKSIQAQKDLETQTTMVQVKRQQALANQQVANTLTPEFLTHEYNIALQQCASNPNCTMIVGSTGNTMVNLKK